MQYNNRTNSPYYVNGPLCDGRRCKYTGLKIINYERAGGASWEFSVYQNGIEIYKISNLQIGELFADNAAAAQYLYDTIAAAPECQDKGIRFGLDILCVTTTDTEYDTANFPTGAGFIYFRDGYDVVLSEAYNPNYLEFIDYLREEGEKATIYHLCRNVSLVLGACSDFNRAADGYSNIYGEQYLEVGGVATWPWGDKPIIMDNCLLCEKCIDVCPRRAIHNKITNRDISLTDMYARPGEERGLREQWAVNTKALDGRYAYGEGGTGGVTDNEVIGGRIFIGYDDPQTHTGEYGYDENGDPIRPANNDIWFNLNDINEV